MYILTQNKVYSEDNISRNKEYYKMIMGLSHPKIMINLNADTNNNRTSNILIFHINM